MDRLKKTLIAALSLALLSMPAHAQLSGQLIKGAVSSTVTKNVAVDSSGRLLVVGSAAGGTAYGPDAVGAAPTQAPLYVSGQYQATTLPTCVTGAICNQQMDVNGNERVKLTVLGASGADAATNTIGYSVDSTTPTTARALTTAGSYFNGTTWDRTRGNTSGAYVQGPVASGSALGGNPVLVGISDGTNVVSARGNALGIYAQGNVASAATDSGNPVKIGGVYNSAPPTFTNGQRGDVQINAAGSIKTSIYNTNGTSAADTGSFGSAIANANIGLLVNSRGALYDGSTSQPARAIDAASTTGVGVAAVAIAPNSAAGSAIDAAVSTALESGRVLKASAGNLYRITVTTSSVAGYLMVFNSTTVPADGAVTPELCRVVAANTSLEVDHSTIPDRYTTGISAAFSTTGCFTKTASVTAMFEGSVQ